MSLTREEYENPNLIADLKARAEKAERDLATVLNEPGYTAVLNAKIAAEARAEKAERERDEAVSRATGLDCRVPGREYVCPSYAPCLRCRAEKAEAEVERLERVNLSLNRDNQANAARADSLQKDFDQTALAWAKAADERDANKARAEKAERERDAAEDDLRRTEAARDEYLRCARAAEARAEKTERERDEAYTLTNERLVNAVELQRKTEARAEKAEAEVEWLRLERGTTVAITVALREELDKRDEGVRFWQSGCDTANDARAAAEARADRLAAALQEIAAGPHYDGFCKWLLHAKGPEDLGICDCHVGIAARALADGEEK